MVGTTPLIKDLHKGDKKALSRAISMVENGTEDSLDLLDNLKPNNRIPVTGLTGPPGSGKSTLLNSLIARLVKKNKKVGVIAIDPTSPFNLGALLGDRIRMQDHFSESGVFIRSLATRGSLGGLSDKTIEILDVMRCSDFDHIFIETVGVGQSEVEIAGLADTTVLVMVPDSGDEVQILKSGIMEIADIIVVNKGDRPGADEFVKKLLQIVGSDKINENPITVLKTTAVREEGIKELLEEISTHKPSTISIEKKAYLMAEKAFILIQKARTTDIDKDDLLVNIQDEMEQKDFNLYRFIKQRYNS